MQQEKNGFETFMRKEIEEQSEKVRLTLRDGKEVKSRGAFVAALCLKKQAQTFFLR